MNQTLIVETANIQWIAGIMRLPEMLADMPFLTSYLQNFRKVRITRQKDNQLLNGNGTPQLDGLLPNATSLQWEQELS